MYGDLLITECGLLHVQVSECLSVIKHFTWIMEATYLYIIIDLRTEYTCIVDKMSFLITLYYNVQMFLASRSIFSRSIFSQCIQKHILQKHILQKHILPVPQQYFSNEPGVKYDSMELSC